MRKIKGGGLLDMIDNIGSDGTNNISSTLDSRSLGNLRLSGRLDTNQNFRRCNDSIGVKNCTGGWKLTDVDCLTCEEITYGLEGILIDFESIADFIVNQYGVNPSLSKKVNVLGNVYVNTNSNNHIYFKYISKISGYLDITGEICPEFRDGLIIGADLTIHYCPSLLRLPDSICSLTVHGSVGIILNSMLEELPENFGNMMINKNLLIRKNPLVRIPDSFGNFQLAGSLEISYSNISSLPDGFCNIGVYKDMIIAHNTRLTALPECFGNVLADSFILTHNWLSNLPESFGKLSADHNIDLSYNNLTVLPNSFGNLQIGGHLKLSSNNLTFLPSSFADIYIGGSLSISNNHLNDLPSNFGELQVGESINLSNNNLSELPTSFVELQAESINLSDNQLTTLHENFGNMAVTQTLNLSSNLLSYLPESFANYNGMNLIVSNNLFTEDDIDFIPDDVELYI